MSAFYATKRIIRPEQVIPFLGKGEAHWRKGFSAYELAYSWLSAAGIPQNVRDTLDSVAEYMNAELLQAYFERETDLRSSGRDSQSDLLAYARSSAGTFVIGVEGKVEEPFGEIVSDWNTGSPTRIARLESLCDLLGLDINEVGHLRYQLFHRTAAAIYEAQAFGCERAIMLVHSFSKGQRWLDDFQNFTRAIGAGADVENRLSTEIARGGIRLRLGWVSDTPC